jgi:hypothetical protein
MEGETFIETLWFSYANRIIDLACKTYGLNREQEDLLRAKIKRGDIEVKPRGLHGSENTLILDAHVIEAWGHWLSGWKEHMRTKLRKHESSTHTRLKIFTEKHLKQ